MATEPTPAFPLRTTLTPCPQCQACTLIRVWHHATKGAPPRMEELALAQNPIAGDIHQCSRQKENVV